MRIHVILIFLNLAYFSVSYFTVISWHIPETKGCPQLNYTVGLRRKILGRKAANQETLGPEIMSLCVKR
jgi:hypothetical protein